jgi:hypothetical protein
MRVVQGGQGAYITCHNVQDVWDCPGNKVSVIKMIYVPVKLNLKIIYFVARNFTFLYNLNNCQVFINFSRMLLNNGMIIPSKIKWCH